VINETIYIKILDSNESTLYNIYQAFGQIVDSKSKDVDEFTDA
jgi:hypothetical protein